MTAARDEIIAYLVDRRFKRFGNEPFPSMESWLQSQKGTVVSIFSLSQEEQIYEASLKKLSAPDLKALLVDVMNAEGNEQKARQELEDQQRFFNEPQAEADFDHWSKMPRWMLDEATALSLGKAPEVVNWEKIKLHLCESPFAKEYEKRRNLLQCACDAQELDANMLPSKLVAWLERTNVALPAKLKDALCVTQRRVDDWDSLRTERDELKLKLAKIVSEKPLGTRERNTLYKIIIGMAMEKYKYDVNAEKQHTAASIAASTRKIEVPVTAETILKVLREAAKELP